MPYYQFPLSFWFLNDLVQDHTTKDFRKETFFVFQNLVWKIFASVRRKKVEECPVIFENVRVLKHLLVTDSGKFSSITADNLDFLGPPLLSALNVPTLGSKNQDYT